MNRNFRRLWGAQATSAFGSRLTRTALPMMGVVSIVGDPIELGILSALTVGPGAAVGLLGGGAIDRSRKLPILIGADLARFVLLLSVPLVAWFADVTMVQLYVVAALSGVASTLFQITDNTYLPVIVEDDDLLEANTKLETTEAAAEVAGPGVAGVLISLISAPLTILVDALTYVASALMLSRIDVREEPAATEPNTSLIADVRAGAKAVWRVPLVRQLFLVSSVVAFFGSFFFTLYYLLTLRVLRFSEWQIGWVISVGGIGALLGAALAGRISRTRRAAPVLLVLLALSQLGDLLIPLAQGSLWVVLTILISHQLISDGFGVAYSVFAVSLRQTLISREHLGRANAFFQVAESVLVPIGAIVAGVLGSVVGIREAIWIGVAGGLTAPLLFLPLIRASITLRGSETTSG